MVCRDYLNIINVCLKQKNGFEKLFDVLYLFDGETIAFQTLLNQIIIPEIENLEERKQAYTDALRQWQILKQWASAQAQATQAIARLNKKIKQKQFIANLHAKLSKRKEEIKPIYAQIDIQLRQMKNQGINAEAKPYLNMLKQFALYQLSAPDLMRQYTQEDQQIPKTPNDLNYQSLAQRLQQGNIVMFLGIDLPAMCDHQTFLNMKQIVSKLAEYVNYPDFRGNLAEICEYMDMNDQFGRELLCDQLQTLIEPQTQVSVQFYQLLAQIEKPLLLISATYDTLLEQTFHHHQKKFVVLYPPEEGDTFFLQYSDREQLERYSSETLSGQPLLEQGYSVIYKILGGVNKEISTEALILSEKDYFRFSQSQNKLIPSYIIKQLRNRGFWILGHYLKSWEKRLIIKSLLERYQCAQQALTILQDVDKFANLYLQNQRIKNYCVDLQEFVTGLQEYL